MAFVESAAAHPLAYQNKLLCIALEGLVVPKDAGKPTTLELLRGVAEG